MKNVQTKLMALAGTLAIAAGTVYAQVTSLTLRASIPFSFQVGAHEMQAGDYQIRHNGSIWTFTNDGTSERAQSVPTSPVYGKETETANLEFACGDNASHCVLRTINSGRGNAGAHWAPPKGQAGSKEVAQIVVIPVTAE